MTALVLWSRIGSAYSPSELRKAIETQKVIDIRGMLRPSKDVALYRAEMAEWPGAGDLRDYKNAQRDWVKAPVAKDANGCGILPSASIPTWP